MKIRELLTDKSKWTQGAYALNKDGVVVDPDIESAIPVCFCLSGALKHCYRGEEYKRNYVKLSNFLFDTRGDSIIAWNDTPGRTFEEVKQLVETLDI